MTFLAIALSALAVIATIYTAARIAKEPRKSTHGLLIVFSIVVTWIAALVVSLSIDANGELPLLIAYGPIIGGIMLLVASAALLLVNGAVVVRKEGLRIATLVPTVFGLALLGIIVLSLVAAFTIETIPGLIFFLLLIAFVTVPFGMILIQLVGFTAYAVLYSRLGDSRVADYIVVHGAGLNGEDLTPLLRSRVDKGIEIFQQLRAEGLQPKLVLSGGQGPDEVISEAEAMARYALAHGVDEEFIIREDRSTTTEENVRFVGELLQERLEDGVTLESLKIVFVTSDYHVLRTATLTRRLGIPGSVIGARTALYYVPAGFLREFVATLKQFAKVNLIIWACITALFATAVGSLVYLSAQQKYPVDENGNEIRPTVEAPQTPGNGDSKDDRQN
ncbi:YdcF family protein [Corynebacterium urogenitale]